MVKDQKNSYVLYFKGGTVFNNDTKRYNPNTKIKFQVDGFDSPNLDAFFDKGVLNKVASLYRDSSYSLDIPGVIIPKRELCKITVIWKSDCKPLQVDVLQRNCSTQFARNP